MIDAGQDVVDDPHPGGMRTGRASGQFVDDRGESAGPALS